MIIIGYSNINEKLQGELADALKNMENSDKNYLFRHLDGNVDFSRAISKAVTITSARDPRLKDPNNIIFGVYTNADDNKKGLTIYYPSDGANPRNALRYKCKKVLNRLGKIVEIDQKKDFLTIGQWVNLMSSIYIIAKDSAPKYNQIRDERDSKKKEQFRIKYKNIIDSLPKNGFFSKSSLAEYLSIHEEIPLSDSDEKINYKYVLILANSENIKMSDKLKEQLIEEGLYNSSYIGFVTDLNMTAPYPERLLPIYGRSDKYVTKWFNKSLKSALYNDLEGGTYILERANRFAYYLTH